MARTVATYNRFGMSRGDRFAQIMSIGFGLMAGCGMVLMFGPRDLPRPVIIGLIAGSTVGFLSAAVFGALSFRSKN